MRPLWVIYAGSKCLRRGGKREISDRAEGCVTPEAKPGGLQPQAQSHLEPEELAEAGGILASSLWRERTPAHTWTSDIWPPSVGVFCYSGLKGLRHSHSCQGAQRCWSWTGWVQAQPASPGHITRAVTDSFCLSFPIHRMGLAILPTAQGDCDK